jgi:predicted DNA-binding protein
MKKQQTPTSFRMATDVFERLEEFCEESGQSKTLAVERAITMYINDYEAKKKQVAL